jgi:hypothetical protein
LLAGRGGEGAPSTCPFAKSGARENVYDCCRIRFNSISRKLK